MITVKVGEPLNKQVGDYWFDPTTRTTAKAIPNALAGTISVSWVPMISISTLGGGFPSNPKKGDVYIEPVNNIPSLFDGTSWIPAVPTGYQFPPTIPLVGDVWLETLSMTLYIFLNGQWTTTGQTQPPNPNTMTTAMSTIQVASNIMQPNNLVISGPNGDLVTINTADGTITYGAGYTPDAAAQIFWYALASTSPDLLQNRIDDLVKDLQVATSRLAIAEDQVLKFKEAGHKIPEPPKPFDPNESWQRSMGIIK